MRIIKFFIQYYDVIQPYIQLEGFITPRLSPWIYYLCYPA